MVYSAILFVSIGLCFVGPGLITYMANRRLLKIRRLWVRVVALFFIFTLSFIAIVLGAVKSGVVPFER